MILTIIFSIFSIILFIFGYVFLPMVCGMGLHTLYFLHKNSKRTLQYMLAEGVTIKSRGMDFHWSKTDFGDYTTRWVLLNQITRNKLVFDIIMDISGNIIKIEGYEANYINNYIRKGIDLSKFVSK